MRAVILAAGKGTRLGNLTKAIPKPMIPIASKPVVEHIMRMIQDAGIDDFVLVTRYLSQQIEAHLGDGSRFGMRVHYAPQDDRYGTAAALLAARELAMDGPLMMTYADVIMSPENYSGALDVYKRMGGAGVITINRVPDPCTGASVEFDDEGKVAKVVEKPPPGTAPSYSNSSGLLIFDPIIFDYLDRLEPSGRGEYELADALNAMAKDGLAIHPYHLQGFWRDVGTVEDMAVAERLLVDG